MRAAPRSLWFLPVLLLIGGCSDKQCDPLPDLGQLAELGADAAREAPPPTCRKDQVKCAAGELNAFGICLAESTMAKVAGGEFTMGQADPGKPWDPAHKVTLKAYQIDLTEVTVEQYQACVDCGACQRPLRNGSNTGR